MWAFLPETSLLSVMRRRLVIERLSDRHLLAGDLPAPYEPLDVNGDGQVSASDAIWVVNWMGQPGRSMRADTFAARLRDVDGSGFVTARDALLIINRLNGDSPFCDLRLASDTGPGGKTNFDRVTSDATIQGRVVSPPRQTLAAFSLRGISNLGREESLNLAEYMVGDNFEVPSREIESLLRPLRGNASDAFRVELVAHTDDAFSDDVLVLADLEFVYDDTAPELLLPFSLDVADETASLTILEPSGVTADSLSTLGIRQPMPNQPDDGPERSFQTETLSERVFVDIALEQFGLSVPSRYRFKSKGRSRTRRAIERCCRSGERSRAATAATIHRPVRLIHRSCGPTSARPLTKRSRPYGPDKSSRFGFPTARQTRPTFSTPWTKSTEASSRWSPEQTSRGVTMLGPVF